MAGITTKGSYGLAAMYELACHYQQGPLKIHQIADKASIPQNYLEHILSSLRKEGLIQSILGARGGYILAKAPSEISVYTVLVILEGGLCMMNAGPNAVLNKLWERAANEMQELFKESLQELVDEGKKLNNQSMYFI